MDLWVAEKGAYGKWFIEHPELHQALQFLGWVIAGVILWYFVKRIFE